MSTLFKKYLSADEPDLLSAIIKLNKSKGVFDSVFDERLKVKLSYLMKSKGMLLKDMLIDCFSKADGACEKELSYSHVSQVVSGHSGVQIGDEAYWARLDSYVDQFLDKDVRDKITSEIDDNFSSKVSFLDRHYVKIVKTSDLSADIYTPRVRLRVAFSFVNSVKRKSASFLADNFSSKATIKNKYAFSNDAISNYIRKGSTLFFETADDDTIDQLNRYIDGFMTPKERKYLDGIFVKRTEKDCTP